MSNTPLDQSAAELGMGGHLAPEKDDAGYRKRMERRQDCLLYTSPSPRDVEESRMPSSA